MMLSDNKINVLTNKLLKGLLDSRMIVPIQDETLLRKEIKRTIIDELKVGEEIDGVVRKKLQSFTRKVVEGSTEWDVLYKKFFEEEEVRRGRRQ